MDGGEYEVTLNFGSYFVRPPHPITWANIDRSAWLAIQFPHKEPFDRLNAIAFRLQHLLSL